MTFLGSASFDWTERRLALLRKRHAEQAPASQIATELGTTKGTVCGKLYRLGLRSEKKNPKNPEHGPEHPWSHGKKPSAAKPKRGTPPPRPATKRQPQRAKKKPEEPMGQIADIRIAAKPIEPPRDRKRLRITDLRANECRFPFGELLDPPGFFCGAPTDGGSWCPVHRARRVRRPRERRDGPAVRARGTEGGMSEGHNSAGMVTGFIDRLERLDEEKRALGKDFTDLLEDAASSTGFSKVSFRNILRERRKSRHEVHATYVELVAIRRALKMRDPLLPPEEDDDSPGTMPERSAGATNGEPFVRLGEALRALYPDGEVRVETGGDLRVSAAALADAIEAKAEHEPAEA
jgi:uncharacterized protein (UPF0335 family)